MSQTFYVYRITKNNNKKGQPYVYIGQRKCPVGKTPEKDLGVKYFSSCKHLKKEIKELGKDKFQFEILGVFKDPVLCLDVEIMLHQKYDVANNKDYYNKANQLSNGFCNPVGADGFNKKKKRVRFVNKNGSVFIHKGIREFCRKYELDPSTICKVLRKERKSHKGWNASYVY